MATSIPTRAKFNPPGNALIIPTPLGELRVEDSPDNGSEQYFGFQLYLGDRLLALVEVLDVSRLEGPEDYRARMYVYDPVSYLPDDSQDGHYTYEVRTEE